MTDATIDAALGATTGLLAVGILANTAGQMLGKGRRYRRHSQKMHKHKGGKTKWW